MILVYFRNFTCRLWWRLGQTAVRQALPGVHPRTCYKRGIFERLMKDESCKLQIYESALCFITTGRLSHGCAIPSVPELHFGFRYRLNVKNQSLCNPRFFSAYGIFDINIFIRTRLTSSSNVRMKKVQPQNDTHYFSHLNCQSSDGKRPSMTFLDLP